MISRVKNVEVDDPIDFLWKNLRYFLDVKWVTDQIVRAHRVPDKQKQNATKQATQLAYCIRQAEEYFRAASQVGLATRPLLLYYGAVSLTKALTLLRLDGRFSFDGLRKANQHQHHGLELLGTIKQIRPEDGVGTFFDSIRCKCYVHPAGTPGSATIPWGHFPLFYEALVPSAYLCSVLELGSSARIEESSRLYARPCSEKMPVAAISGRVFNPLGIMKVLPDLHDELLHYKICPELALGRIEVIVTVQTSPLPEAPPAGPTHRSRRTERITHRIWAGEHVKARLKELFAAKNPAYQLTTQQGRELQCLLADDTDNPTPGNTRWQPTITAAYNNDQLKYYVLAPDDYIDEAAGMLIVLFCLGMVSRYYADIWMNAIDNNVQTAAVTDSFLNLANRKFPNLILDQMTYTLHRVRAT
jgi:hypothetical protein